MTRRAARQVVRLPQGRPAVPAAAMFPVDLPGGSLPEGMSPTGRFPAGHCQSFRRWLPGSRRGGGDFTGSPLGIKANPLVERFHASAEFGAVWQRLGELRGAIRQRGGERDPRRLGGIDTRPPARRPRRSTEPMRSIPADRLTRWPLTRRSRPVHNGAQMRAVRGVAAPRPSRSTPTSGAIVAGVGADLGCPPSSAPRPAKGP